MSDPASPPRDCLEGWHLGRDTYSFHRQFFWLLGRPTEPGEYSAILALIRYRLAQQVGDYFWLVTLPDGTPLVVNGNWHRLGGVRPAHWRPRRVADHPPLSPKMLKALAAKTIADRAARKAAKALEAAKAARETVAPEPPKAVAPPPAPRPMRASTLTLSNPQASRALAERLRRIGVPATTDARGPPP